MAQVHLRGVKKSYDNKLEVIHGIDMQIADGEFIVIVGPSGCGKSTLLRMVAGLERITGGQVAIGERVVNELEPKDRDIAMVFQNYALYPHMSVYDNMAYGLKIRGMSKDEIERRVQKAAKTLELGTFLKRRPRQLSGGQRQRVAMGRAIVREPAVFLFDEPLSNLDAKLRVQMRLEIKRLQRELAVATRVTLPLGRTTSAAAGTPVALGIRPEHLHPAADGPLEFEIELAEPLGADTLLHGRFGEARELVTVRQGGHIKAQPGEKRHFKADPGYLHLFDSQTGRRIAEA